MDTRQYAQQEGPFAPLPQPGQPVIVVNEKGEFLPAFPGAPTCRLVVTYAPDRPDVPQVEIPWGSCWAGADVALAALVSLLLKASFFPPGHPSQPLGGAKPPPVTGKP